MRNKFLLKTALLFVSMLFFNFALAQTTISGSVSTGDQEALPGVNILISGTNFGTTTDFDGNFTIATSMPLPVELEISYLGFQTQIIEVTSEDQEISVSLSPGGNDLDAVIVSASRKREKVLDAPASVSIVSSRDIENSVTAVDPVRNLMNVPGVQLQQQSANSLNIEMRAGAGVFGTSTFPILDYRYLVTPAAGTFFTFQSGLSNIDIDRIEVVRGSGSAMYGPGVTSGVVHFLSKSAIDHPGTTVELMAGSMQLQGFTLRHAWANDDKTLGYKINASVRKGNDFQLDPVEDAGRIASLATTVSQPLVSNMQVNNTAPGQILLAQPDLDQDGDGNPMINEFKNQSANFTLEYRPDTNTSAVLAAGIANGGGLFFNSQGPGYTQGTDWWAQARYRSGGLFAQAYYNANDGGTAENPTFLYNTGLRQVASRNSLEAQIQYNFDVPDFLNTNFTIGADYRDTDTDSEYTLYGRFDDDDQYTIMGAYVQGTSALTDKLDLNYAVRYDTFNFIDEGGLSPRVALVYKADEKNTFRASYNIATTGPTSLQQYIDFPVSTVQPAVFDVWLSGQNDVQTINPNGFIDSTLLPGDNDFPTSITGLPLAVPYQAISAAANVAINQFIAGGINPLTMAPDPNVVALQPFLGIVNDFLNGYAGPGLTQMTGSLYAYDVFDLANAAAESRLPRAFNAALSGAEKSKIEYQNSFEVGYKGIWEDKLGVSVDFYTYERKGFTQFAAVGPSYWLITDAAQMTSDMATAVGTDAAAGLTAPVTAAITALTTAQYQANAVALSLDFAQMAAGNIPGIPSLAQTVAATVPTVVTGLAGMIGGVYGSATGNDTPGAASFWNAASAAFPIFGALESAESPKGDGMVHSPAGYRRFGDAVRSHWGTDIALEYYVNDKVTLWANGSYLSQNYWAVGDDDLPFEAYLNTPKVKYRGGIMYGGTGKGMFGSITYQHDDTFESNQGEYGGTVQEKDLIDLNLGYKFDNGVNLNLSATNLFDEKYRAMPGMPVIGRRTVLTATYSFQ